MAKEKKMGIEPENFSSVKQAAREYADRGWTPIRLHPEDKNPVEKGWQNTTVDADDAFDQFDDDSNIGIILGPKSDHLVDVDCDCPEAVTAAAHLLPETPLVHGRYSAPSSHYWYRCKNAGKTKRFKGPAGETLIELRSSTTESGSFTMVPPSTHPDGEELIWEGPLKPVEVDAEELVKSVRWVAAAALIAQSWGEGSRHETALALSGLLARNEVPIEDAQRFIEAICCAAGDEEVEDRLKAVASTYKLVAAKKPVTGGRTLAQLLGAEKVRRVAEWLQMSPLRDSYNGPPPVCQVLGEYTVVWNAKWFVANHQNSIRYATSAWGWLYFDGKRWVKDVDTAHVLNKVKELTLAMPQHAMKLTTQKERNALLKWALRSQSMSNISDTERLARVDDRIRCRPEDFDACPFLLNVHNGTLDLRTGQLSAHDPGQMLTKLIPVPYCSDSESPQFQQFLNTIFSGDTELIQFVQRALGHALLGGNPTQKLFILYGHGANGKSVLINCIMDLLGSDYAHQLNPETLIERTNTGAPRADLAALQGIRLVSATEMNDRSKLDEALVKQMTGGDRIRARFLYSSEFEFLPQFTVFVSTNHRPYVSSQGHGIWRRLATIPFTVTIPQHQQDPHLKDRLLEESTGILAWLVRGCREYQQYGLKLPDAVIRATNQYREDMDTLGTFLEENTIDVPNETVRTQNLYDRYRKWCEEMGLRQMSQKEMTRRLEQRGYERTRKSNGVHWLDLSLLSEALIENSSFDIDQLQPSESVADTLTLHTRVSDM